MSAPRILALALLGAAACGGGAREAPPAAGPPEAPAEVPPTVGAIPRADLDLVLDAGLPAFLAGVDFVPVVDGDRFVGFRVDAFYPGDPNLADVALRAGDVVTTVNGQPIERPEQAHRVWEGLRVASELVVGVLRDGAPHEIRYAIVDAP